jgi:hypothetical protein
MRDDFTAEDAEGAETRRAERGEKRVEKGEG